MATCRHCGRRKIRKRKDGTKKCKSCGFLTGDRSNSPIAPRTLTRGYNVTENEMTKNNQQKTPATVENNLPANASDYSQYANAGFENHTGEDYATPFLGILQGLSPLLETKATAKAGMLVNTVTQDVYDGKEGVLFIPAYTDHVVVEWKTREEGGGFVKVHQLSDELIQKVQAEQEFGKWKVIKGDVRSNDLIETRYVYGVFINPATGSSEQMVIAFTGSKMKTYKRWMTKARTVQLVTPNGRINLPLFAHKYRVTTVSEKNKKGTFYNFVFDFDNGSAEQCRLPTNDPLFQQAVSFAELVKEGKVKTATDTQAATGEEPVEDDKPFA